MNLVEYKQSGLHIVIRRSQSIKLKHFRGDGSQAIELIESHLALSRIRIIGNDYKSLDEF
ncbi:hypothetical protein VCRA2123E76_10109 [Vibrio crassostreae]|nr:hypothetical protein VCRA2123E76_10109 [Vibrio crassostreae]